MKIHPSNSTGSIIQKSRLFILCLGVMGLLQGCDNKSSGTADGTPPKRLHLGFIANTADEYWSTVELGCNVAARQLGDVDVDFRFPSEHTAKEQQELMGQFIAHGVDGIAISTIDADDQTDFLNNIATNTLLVCADSDAEKSKRVCYIGTDNVAAGKQAAQLIKAALPQGGKIVLLVGYPNAQNTKARVQGIQDGLAGSGVQIIDTVADDHKSSIAQQNAEDALAKNPDLAGIIGIYGYHGPAILTAVRSGGKAGKVKIVCFDEDSDTLAGIASGDIYGTVIQQPLLIGNQTVQRMVKYLRGDKTQLGGGQILISSQVITTKQEVETFQNSRKDILNALSP